MNIKIIEYAVAAIKNFTSLSEKVIDAGSPEKYANGIEKMSKSVDDTYAVMRDIVAQDNTLTTDEKLNRLNAVADSQQRAKEKCGEAIKGNRENVAKVTFEVVKGFLTCGVSFLPAIIKETKKTLGKKEDQEMIDELVAETGIVEENTEK